MQRVKKGVEGITLIALVVTIIVLLILAGIAINLTIGNNGLFSRAEEAALESRGGAVEEAKELWKADVTLASYTNSVEAETLDELLERLLAKKQITEKEKQEIKETGKVTIGSRTIDFGQDAKLAKVRLNANTSLACLEVTENDLLREIINEYIESLSDEKIFVMAVTRDLNKSFQEYMEEQNESYTSFKEICEAEGWDYKEELESIKDSAKYAILDSGVEIEAPDGVEINGIITIDTKPAEYTFNIKIIDKTSKVKLKIGQYEVIDMIGSSRVGVIDTVNKKFLDIQEATVEVEGNVINVDEKYLITEENHIYLDGPNFARELDDRGVEWKYWDFCKVTFKCNEGIISGYASFQYIN